jgi:fumarylacetoacetate (FAA) hydrolase family protein
MLDIPLSQCLPQDAASALLVGRLWREDANGPSVIKIDKGRAIDISKRFPTMRDLCEEDDPAAAARAASGDDLGAIEEFRRKLLAPIDLQAVKAAGVTFAISMLERVIEERARGNPESSATIRKEIASLIGDDLSKLKPGSPEAMQLKKVLIAQGLWSAYLEVGIGPDAEIFTKSQVLSSVGHGADAGINAISKWNNPEPEVVLVVSSKGKIAGATLGNDVNLRDIEGRSALLLGKAKDNNASCAIGPFIRLFDASFTLDHVRRLELTLKVEGPEGYVLNGRSSMRKISRDPADLVAQMINDNHQYPDGAVLFCGTLFAPIDDRDTPGQGFTHKVGDIVTVAAPELGALVNRMAYSHDAPRWTFGVSHLMRNLAKRGLI